MSIPTKITVTDTRTIQVPLPADTEASARLKEFVSQAVGAGYVLSGVTTVKGGDQRDPYTVGAKMTFRRAA